MSAGLTSHVAVEGVIGDLVIPPAARTIVVFAHGSGSSRHSPRNRQVAATLQERGFATLLMDLLTEHEDAVRESRFDIRLLARRLHLASTVLAKRAQTSKLMLAYFGASTGAAAALVAAAREPDRVQAVVSRGGRPDLAGSELGGVRAPTRLIVGGNDPIVLDLNRRAVDQLTGERDLVVVPGATHLFEEPGAIEQVGELAADWFTRHCV